MIRGFAVFGTQRGLIARGVAALDIQQIEISRMVDDRRFREDIPWRTAVGCRNSLLLNREEVTVVFQCKPCRDITRSPGFYGIALCAARNELLQLDYLRLLGDSVKALEEAATRDGIFSASEAELGEIAQGIHETFFSSLRDDKRRVRAVDVNKPLPDIKNWVVSTSSIEARELGSEAILAVAANSARYLVKILYVDGPGEAKAGFDTLSAAAIVHMTQAARQPKSKLKRGHSQDSDVPISTSKRPGDVAQNFALLYAELNAVKRELAAAKEAIRLQHDQIDDVQDYLTRSDRSFKPFRAPEPVLDVARMRSEDYPLDAEEDAEESEPAPVDWLRWVAIGTIGVMVLLLLLLGAVRYFSEAADEVRTPVRRQSMSDLKAVIPKCDTVGGFAAVIDLVRAEPPGVDVFQSVVKFRECLEGVVKAPQSTQFGKCVAGSGDKAVLQARLEVIRLYTPSSTNRVDLLDALEALEDVASRCSKSSRH